MSNRKELSRRTFLQVVGGVGASLALGSFASLACADVDEKARAKSKGVVPIDYDRLTQGGGASYYVSFDNVKVGDDLGAGRVTVVVIPDASHALIPEQPGKLIDAVLAWLRGLS